MNTKLISPYGDQLVNLVVNDGERAELLAYAGKLPSLTLTARSVNDLELLATGAFSPVNTFMNSLDLERVLAEMRLDNGILFPVPITLPTEHFEGLRLDTDIALRDTKNDLLAILTIQEIYEWSPDDFSLAFLGTLDRRHPLSAELGQWGKFNLSGKLRVLNLPAHFDSLDLRNSPAQLREKLRNHGNPNVVAFQTRNPIHRAHEELIRRAAETLGATLLIHPAVGLTKPDDIDQFTRIRTYRALVSEFFDELTTILSLTPIAMRFAGPREALWHAIIRRNYGANHFIVGRDHASPGVDSAGRPFYDPNAARELVCEHAAEIVVGVAGFDELVYLPDEDRYEERSRIPAGAATFSLSGTEIREVYLDRGRHLPPWFTRPATAAILAEAYPPRERQGFCLWFTGLSGAGKSTTAEIVATMLRERGRRVTVLDGDVVRTNLSKGLGFSRDDRDANIRRIGFVAAEIVRHGGAVICATVSPYRATRDEVRNLVGPENFIEIFVNTPLAVCEDRDTKGMYAKARRGEIKDFTGVDDIYEDPQQPEITLETTIAKPMTNAMAVMELLLSRGFLAGIPEPTDL